MKGATFRRRMDGFSDGAAVAVCRLMGVSAVVGATYNFENDHTNYQNGVDSHLDWAENRVKGFALYAVVAIPLG